MQKVLLLYISILMSSLAYGGWIDLNTGINDNLTGVVFNGNNGVVSGHQGLYYTTTGGAGAASWTRFDISTNTGDSILYNNTKFEHLYTKYLVSGYVFACGRDTVNNQAVLLQLNLPSLTYQVLYLGPVNSGLNNISYCYTTSDYYAVGNNGLVVKFAPSVSASNEAVGLTENLTSISFSGADFWIGADGKRIYGTDLNPGLSITTNSSDPTRNYQDVLMQSAPNRYGVGDAYYRGIGTLVNSIYSYSGGALNGRAIHRWGSFLFVATDHGIYRDGGVFGDYLEWQPTSGNSTINDFWFENSALTVFYACGDNGVLMVTNDNGGETQPYVSISTGGASGECVNTPFLFEVETGSSTSCSWYIDGVFVYSGCNNFGTVFNPAGVYEVMLVGTNTAGGYSDTAIVNMNIVDPPEINLSLNYDSIICKGGPIDVIIDTAQLNVSYMLVHTPTLDAYGFSSPGSGSSLTFTSDSLYLSGDYHLIATNILGDCSVGFTDTISLEIENTTANFFTSLVNCTPGDSVKFYEQTLDAANFSWEFSPNSSPNISSAPDPVSTFGNPGNTNVKLICWSNNGCYDSITKPGPLVYSPPSPMDSCWLNHDVENDPPWQGNLAQKIASISKCHDGYLTSVQFDNTIVIGTQHGDTITLSGGGGYALKSDIHGASRWVVSSDKEILSAVEDSQKNIYVSIYSDANYFVDNSGDTIYFDLNGEGAVIKLDSLGKIVWHRSGKFFKPYSLYIDRTDNIYVSFQHLNAGTGGIPGYATPIGFNGVIDDTLGVLEPDLGWALLKLGDDGIIHWDMVIDHAGPDLDFSIENIGFDSDNNLYLMSHMGIELTFYEPMGTTEILSFSGSGYSGDKAYIAKIDSTGNVLWISYGRRDNQSVEIEGWGVAVDDEGNSYLTGRNSVLAAGSAPHYWVSSNGDSTKYVGGGYYVLKVDSSGICKWITGCKWTYAGHGGQKVALYNNEIYVLGLAYTSNWAPGTTLFFMNGDSTGISLDIEEYDYFVAVYDTNGRIQRILRNGLNPSSFIAYANPMTAFLSNNDGSFLISKNWRIINPTSPYCDFTNCVDITQGYDGWVTKFTESCAIIYDNTEYFTFQDTIVCSGATLTFPSGVNTTVSGNMEDLSTLIATNGMDSTIVTTVYTSTPPSTSQNLTACAGSPFVFPDGSIDTLYGFTTQTSTITGMNGCDSVIVSYVSVIQSFSSTELVNICDGTIYTFPDGSSQLITGNTTQISVLTALNGCDSTVTTNVVAQYPLNVNVDANACEGDYYTYPDGFGEIISSNTSHVSNLTTVFGCDSLVETFVTMLNVYGATVTDSVCENGNYTFPDGTVENNIINVINHTSPLTTVFGCDSIIQTTVTPILVDATVSQTDTLISANAIGVLYQWLDCDSSFAMINGETGQSFAASQNGNYAVQVIDNGCIDTSACILISNVGIIENDFGNDFVVYPNPTEGMISVSLGTTYDFIEVKIVDVNGKVISNETFNNVSTFIVNIESAAGNYILDIFAQEKRAQVKVIKE